MKKSGSTLSERDKKNLAILGGALIQIRTEATYGQGEKPEDALKNIREIADRLHNVPQMMAIGQACDAEALFRDGVCDHWPSGLRKPAAMMVSANAFRISKFELATLLVGIAFGFVLKWASGFSHSDDVNIQYIVFMSHFFLLIIGSMYLATFAAIRSSWWPVLGIACMFTIRFAI